MATPIGEAQLGRQRNSNTTSIIAEEEKQAEEEKKIEIHTDASQTNATFIFKDEDHTFGNTIRYMLNKTPTVDFVGYTIPHPAIPKLHLRLQTNPGVPAVEALDGALDNLINIGDHVGGIFRAALQEFESSN